MVGIISLGDGVGKMGTKLIKKIFTLLLVLAIILLLIPSCNGTETDSPPTSPGEPAGPYEIILSLSPLPKLGETAELIFITKINFLPGPEYLANARAWVEFSYANTKGSYSEAKYAVPVPLDEVLVDGELTWEGNAIGIMPLELTGTIQLPREGVWKITGYFSGEDWEKPFKKERRIAVTEDAAAIIGTEDFKSGPLGYLDNFNYGHGVKRVPDERFDPVILELDISKVPRVGEEVILTCRILSMIDAPDYSVQISFTRRLEDNSILKIPGDSLLVDGNLKWEGDLKKDEPVEFSASIKFPEDGDWEIMALGDCPTNDKLEFAYRVKMNIAGDKGSFGWEGYP